MTCEEVQSLLITSQEAEIPSAVREDIRQHIEGCAQCTAAQAELRHLQYLMESTPEALPGPGLEKQFRKMLRTAEQEQKAVVRPVTRRMYVWRNVAAAVVILAVGVGIGTRLTTSGPPERPLSKTSMNTITRPGDSADTDAFALLKSASASERIKAVNYAEAMTSPDRQVIDALVNTLDHDKNANVRLACLYSLAKFSDNPKVRDAMVYSLPLQTEPIVQIVLINLLTEMKERKAIRPFQDIISNDKTSKEVKHIAEKGLRVM
jgi:hypothetical protein